MQIGVLVALVVPMIFIWLALMALVRQLKELTSLLAGMFTYWLLSSKNELSEGFKKFMEDEVNADTED